MKNQKGLSMHFIYIIKSTATRVVQLSNTSALQNTHTWCFCMLLINLLSNLNQQVSLLWSPSLIIILSAVEMRLVGIIWNKRLFLLKDPNQTQKQKIVWFTSCWHSDQKHAIEHKNEGSQEDGVNPSILLIRIKRWHDGNSICIMFTIYACKESIDARKP